MFGVDDRNRRVRGIVAARGLLVAAGVALLGVGGCGGLGEQGASSVLVTPGKYDMHSCQDIENNIRNRRGREAELQRLMAQASGAVGGEFVNAIAYRSDYLQNRAEIEELVRTAANKQCTAQSPWSSQRAVF